VNKITAPVPTPATRAGCARIRLIFEPTGVYGLLLERLATQAGFGGPHRQPRARRQGPRESSSETRARATCATPSPSPTWQAAGV
jgi:hypothetical protein